MSVAPTVRAPATPSGARWGYCPRCERWRLTDAWNRDGGRARCPVCASAPDPLETVDGAHFRLVLHLAADDGPGHGAPGG